MPTPEPWRWMTSCRPCGPTGQPASSSWCAPAAAEPPSFAPPPPRAQRLACPSPSLPPSQPTLPGPSCQMRAAPNRPIHLLPLGLRDAARLSDCRAAMLLQSWPSAHPEGCGTHVFELQGMHAECATDCEAALALLRPRREGLLGADGSGAGERAAGESVGGGAEGAARGGSARRGGAEGAARGGSARRGLRTAAAAWRHSAPPGLTPFPSLNPCGRVPACLPRCAGRGLHRAPAGSAGCGPPHVLCPAGVASCACCRLR